MRFKNYYSSNNIDFDKMNKAMFESLRDYSCCKENKKGVDKTLLKTDEQLDAEGFFKKYPHLK